MKAPVVAAHVRREIAARVTAAHPGLSASDNVVRWTLQGYPTRLAAQVLEAAGQLGVDVSAVPKLSAEEVAVWRGRGQPKRDRTCAECAAKDKRLAVLESQLEAALPNDCPLPNNS